MIKHHCQSHDDRLRRNGDVGPAEIKMRHTSRPSCSVAGCAYPAVGRGYCHAHGKRWQKYGSPRADIPVKRYSRGGARPTHDEEPHHAPTEGVAR